MKAYRRREDVVREPMDNYRRYRRRGYKPGTLRLERAGKRRVRADGKAEIREQADGRLRHLP